MVVDGKEIEVEESSGNIFADLGLRVADERPQLHIVRGRLAGYSIERLTRFLILLGQNVEITIRSAENPENAHLSVRVA